MPTLGLKPSPAALVCALPGAGPLSMWELISRPAKE